MADTILDRLENFSLYAYPPGEGVYAMLRLHKAAKAEIEQLRKQRDDYFRRLGEAGLVSLAEMNN